MKQIGYSLVFKPEEIDQARAALATSGESLVRIETTCAECNQYIECTVEDFDNHVPVVHSQNLHEWGEKMGWYDQE